MEHFLRTLRLPRCPRTALAALLVTLCRALGIPARVVTAYECAWPRAGAQPPALDLEVSRAEVRAVRARGGSGAPRPFDAWAEAWSARPDLAEGVGGWHALLLPPGAAGAGAGAVPVEAVRRAMLGVADAQVAARLFAAINVPIRFFQAKAGDPLWAHRPVHVVTNATGVLIVTKKAGKDDDKENTDMEDITHLYKAVKGLGAGPGAFDYEAPPACPDVTFELVSEGKATFGQDFCVALHMHNTCAEARRVWCVLMVAAAAAEDGGGGGGGGGGRLKRAEGVVPLRPGQRESVRLQVTVAEYLHRVGGDGLLRVAAQARVLNASPSTPAQHQQGHHHWVCARAALLRKPRLSVRVRGGVAVTRGRPAPVLLSFVNPLGVPLTRCAFRLDGPDFLPPASPSAPPPPPLVRYRDVRPGEPVAVEAALVARAAGEQRVTAAFSCRELRCITGRAVVRVLPH